MRNNRTEKVGPILLVEDNEDDVFFFRRAMQKARSKQPLQVARDARETIAYLQGTGAYADRMRFPFPSMVLLDSKLPDMPGLDVLKWIRSQPNLRSLVVIMLSASHLDGDIRRAYELGANSFLVKPAHIDDLAKMLPLVQEYWLGMNRQPKRG